MKLIKSLSLCAGLAFATLSAVAQDFPNKPVRIIVPLAAGGGVDIVARAVGGKLTDQLKQPVMIDNKPGASTNIGSEAAAKSRPDGYTLLMASPSATVNGKLFTKIGYDTLRDFTAVVLVANAPLVLVVHPDVPAKTLSELVALAKKDPGKLSYASSGNGSSQHLAGEFLRGSTQIDALHVAYKGGAPALVDLLGGRITFMFNNPLEVLPHIKSGKLRAIATTGAKRSPTLPDIPTVSEAYPGFEVYVWWGLLAPQGTPPDIVRKLNAETVKALQTPELQTRFQEMGATVVASTPEQFGGFLKTEIDKWAKVVDAAGVKPVE